ncbi:eukaryotic translation initiation factor 4E binding protein-domain-containing protein, partial [Endogone sp. FLAS-F59071]
QLSILTFLHLSPPVHHHSPVHQKRRSPFPASRSQIVYTTMSSLSAPMAIRRAAPNTPIPYDYATTPHGTIYSSTPGGTRIIYDRSTLLSLANSPLSRTPPKGLVHVPGVTKGVPPVGSASQAGPAAATHTKSHLSHEATKVDDDDEEEEEQGEEEEEGEDDKMSRSVTSIEKGNKHEDMFEMDM